MATLYDVNEVRPGFVIESHREVQPKNGRSFQLDELYALLRCETIEVVRTKNPTTILICDEESKLSDPPRPFNGGATPLANLFRGDWIAGPALLCLDSELE